jgi:predicted RNase H-like nuclease (RuvC/YqgF family)
MIDQILQTETSTEAARLEATEAHSTAIKAAEALHDHLKSEKDSVIAKFTEENTILKEEIQNLKDEITSLSTKITEAETQNRSKANDETRIRHELDTHARDLTHKSKEVGQLAGEKSGLEKKRNELNELFAYQAKIYQRFHNIEIAAGDVKGTIIMV